MADTKERELLLLRLMHLIAEKFKNVAVLKGGMYLRLLNSPRLTQDVDYIFTTKESRKVIAKELKKLIEREEDITIIDTQLNSRGIIMRVNSVDNIALIEISVTEKLNLPPEQMTTSALSIQYRIGGRVITVMALAESYANKIATCIERINMRDLYDLTIYQPLTSFHQVTLKKRLENIQINRGKNKSIGFKEGAQLLKNRVASIKQSDLERELSGLAPEDFMKGGLNIIKNSVNRLCQELESL